MCALLCSYRSQTAYLSLLYLIPWREDEKNFSVGFKQYNWNCLLKYHRIALYKNLAVISETNEKNRTKTSVLPLTINYQLKSSKFTFTFACNYSTILVVLVLLLQLMLLPILFMWWWYSECCCFCVDFFFFSRFCLKYRICACVHLKLC